MNIMDMSIKDIVLEALTVALGAAILYCLLWASIIFEPVDFEPAAEHQWLIETNKQMGDYLDTTAKAREALK